MKVAVCGLVTNENLGEQFISKSLSWLIKAVLTERGYDKTIEFTEVDIEAKIVYYGDYHNFVQKRISTLYKFKLAGLPLEIMLIALKRFARKIPNLAIRNIVFRIRHNIWKHAYNYKRRHLLYFEEKLEGVNLVVVDGAGLLEYSYNEYQEPILTLCEYADNHGIPVIFNAVGCAGEYAPKDFRCQTMKSAFQKDCIKYVSARDSVETVQAYVGGNKEVKLLADAAFWVQEAFKIYPSGSRNPIIGIGLIRGNAFLSYDNKMNEESLIDLFCEIAYELRKRGYAFQFFTNGMKEDYALGIKVLEKMQLDKSFLVERPRGAETLLKSIAEYRGLITCRMHSSIAAFSMGIPSVILSWNEKVDKYMALAGYPDRAIKAENFTSKFIVDVMERALKGGVSQANIMSMKSKAKQSVEEYVDLILAQEEKQGGKKSLEKKKGND